MYQYDKAFFQYTSASNDASAKRVAALLRSWLVIDSVADFGCGAGVWLKTWQAQGVADLAGLDGDYVDRASLPFDPAQFTAVDLSQPIDLKRRFDLVQCVEVAEHLPASAAATIVQTLTKHSDIVLFSAAPPGQGGEHHINEQPYAYWRDLFAAQNYDCFDCIRPLIQSHADVQPWYRYNLFLYVKNARAATMPNEIKAQRILPSDPMPDISPRGYQTRKLILRQLPPAALNALARWNTRLQLLRGK